jgi:hypothetical protein
LSNLLLHSFCAQIQITACKSLAFRAIRGYFLITEENEMFKPAHRIDANPNIGFILFDAFFERKLQNRDIISHANPEFFSLAPSAIDMAG